VGPGYQVSGVATEPCPPQLVLQLDVLYPPGVLAFMNWVTLGGVPDTW
jgi:hypothetical protein